MANINDFKSEIQAARKGAGGSPKTFLASNVHDILADWLEDRDDPRALIVRRRTGRAKAYWKAGEGTDSKFLGPWPQIDYVLNDGSKLNVSVHGQKTKSIKPDHPNVYKYPDVNVHVSWQPFPNPKVSYEAVMTKKEFQNWVRSFPDDEKNRLLATFQNNPQTRVEESKSFDSFGDFLRNEMAGTGAIYDGTKSPDFQWQGAPESMIRPKKKKKR